MRRRPAEVPDCSGKTGGLSRRELLLAAAVLPVSVSAAPQAGRVYRLGFVVSRPQSGYASFFAELARLGFVKGRNLSVDPRGFGLAIDQLDPAAELVVRAQPDAIFCGGDAAAAAGKRATTTIPIVAVADDFLRNRLVASLARPAGNLTGVSILAGELNAKRFELLTELLPGIGHVAALVDPHTASTEHLQAMIDAMRERRVKLSMHSAETPEEIISGIAEARAAGAQALNVLASAFLNAHRGLIIKRAAAVGIPAIYQFPEVCADGGLMGYGTRLSSVFAQAAGMLAKVMTGTKPSDMPVEQPTQIELCVSLGTAHALGVTVPAALLIRAEEIVE
jgi:putative ABC transport system substrate-binding protein